MAVQVEGPALGGLLLDILAKLPDKRTSPKRGRKQDPLPAVLTLSACAALYGAYSVYAVARRGRNQEAPVESTRSADDRGLVGHLEKKARELDEPHPMALSVALPVVDSYPRARPSAAQPTLPTGILWQERRAARQATQVWVWACAYLVALAFAEALAALVNPPLGLSVHSLLLFALLVQGARTNEAQRALLWSLAVAPLLRIISLSLPLAEIPTLYWYAIISVPLFAATFAAARALGYSHGDLGLRVRIRHLPLYVLMVPLGLAIGGVEYILLRSHPLSSGLALAQIWLPALILALSTGLGEELIFRGLLQRAALHALGPWGLVYTTALFTSLHIGQLVALNLVVVFAIGLLFAGIAWRTGSILGPSLAHAAINVSLFLVAPFLLNP